MQNFDHFIRRLKDDLAKPLPGKAAQLKMSPPLLNPGTFDDPARKGGVLLLLYPVNGKPWTVFNRRTEYPGVHSGQISLPGGLYNPDDPTLVHTALRETREETGIGLNTDNVIGALTPLHIPASHTTVHPVVAYTVSRPQFAHDPREVQYLIEISLEELLDPASKKHTMMPIAGTTVDVPYYDLMGQQLWGATAMIVSEFLEIVRRIELLP